MTPPPRRPSREEGSGPTEEMGLMDTERIKFKVHQVSKDLKELTSVMGRQVEMIHSRISASRKFQYLSTGAAMAILALLAVIYATAGDVMKTNMNEVLQESELVGIPVRVELLQKQMDTKASKEGAERRDQEIRALTQKAHTHRR